MQDYDISDSLDVTHEWTTPIGSIDIYLPDVLRQGLINILTRCSKVYEPQFEGVGKAHNLFDYVNSPWEENDKKCIKEFEKISSKIIRTYIKKAWDVPEDSGITVRCWGNTQDTNDMRTLPHYHQRRYGWDGMLLHYLTIGNEFKYPNSRSTSKPYPTEFSGNLMLLDPRGGVTTPVPEYPRITINPQIGTTILHPAYLWHETHAHTQLGMRSAIIVSFSIIDEYHDSSLTKLI